MAQRTVRLGFVGAGRFTRSRLLPNFQTLPGVELVAVSNSTAESGQRVAHEFGFGEVLTDWRTLVALPVIDAVVIGTQAPLHAAIAQAALEAGKHVFTMNAMSATLDDARSMVRIAQQNPHLTALVYPGGFYLREDAWMRRLLQEGYVGRVLQVFDLWHTPFFGLGSQYEVARRWFGEHTRVFAHRKTLDVEIPSPGGRPTRPTANTVLAELEGGGVITYLHAPAARGMTPARIAVYGTEGALICYSQGEARDGIYGAKAGQGEPQPLPVPRDLQAAWADPRRLPVEADFVAAVRGGAAPSPAIPTFQDGARAMEFAEAWRLSLDRAGWVDLPL